MARIDGEITPGAIMNAAMQELQSPTGLMHGPGEMDTNNPDAMAQACQDIVKAHPGA